MSIEERVNGVFIDEIGMEPGEVRPDAVLGGDLGIDSTEMVEVIVALEKRFGIKVPDGVIKADSTVGNVVDFFSRTIS